MSSNRDRDEDRGTRRSRDEEEPRRSRTRDEDEPRSRGRSREDDEPRGRGRDRDEDEPRRSSRRDDDEDRPRRGGGGYQYESRSADSAKRRASMGAQDFDKMLKPHIKMFKPNDGENRIRILPPTWKGADHFGFDVYVHYGVGADRGSYLDLDKMLGKPDPITEERARARDDGDEDYAKELDSKRRVLIYLIDRDHPKEGVQAWAMPWTLDRDINKVSQDKESGAVLEIDHPEEGYDVDFEKKGAKRNTEYLGVAIARRSSPLGKSEWLDFAIDNPLPDQLEYHDYDTIAKAFGGKGRSKGEDRDEPRGRSRDRDDEDRRPSRDRDDDRGRGRAGRGDEEDRPRRGSEREERGGRSRNDDPVAPTWESVHEMTKSELEDLIESEDLDINPKDSKDTQDLADWVCEEMKLKETPKGGGRTRYSEDDAKDEDRLSRMRRERDEDTPRRRRED